MFSTLRDLYYLASEAACIPKRLIEAIAEGVALGWQTTHPDDDWMTAANAESARALSELLAEAEAEHEAWEMNELNDLFAEVGFSQDLVDAYWAATKTSPADGVAIGGPTVGESPAADSAIRPAPAAGHPNRSERRVLKSAAFGLHRWLIGEPCATPTYFASIIHDLEQLS